MQSQEYTPAVVARFWMKVQPADLNCPMTSCWEWQAARYPSGYGMFGASAGDIRGAHRIAYELLVGPVPEGLHLDHLCRVRHCVNPDHMEPVTPAENVLRGVGFAGVNSRKTHCLRGHPLSGPNLYTDPKGRRQCKTCRRAAYFKHKAKRETRDA